MSYRSPPSNVNRKLKAENSLNVSVDREVSPSKWLQILGPEQDERERSKTNSSVTESSAELSESKWLRALDREKREKRRKLSAERKARAARLAALFEDEAEQEQD